MEKFLLDNQKKGVLIKLLRDFFVDVTTSFDSINEGTHFCEISKLSLLKGLFALQKWVINDQKLQLFIDTNENKNIAQNGIVYRKVLKLHWFAESHSFEYNFIGIIKLAKELPATSRSILKIIAMFYDTLGMISPITL